MCGIAGVLNFSGMVVDNELLVAMRDTMFHRGPDGAGIYIDKEVGLAHRRLSIIDLTEKGKQPFHSADNRYTITYNGEIFNYKELRRELEVAGARFISESDTEVLLQLFIKYGSECIQKLNGMFAFAIWDSVKRELFLARDRIGIKPLYYSMYNNSFYFGSEPKALFKGGVDPQVNIDAMPELLLLRYVAGERTVFCHVKRLLPGHFMVVKDGKHHVSRWWNLPEIIKKNRERLPNKPFEWFENIFYSSVKYRTISDVPVGVMLSGGLDSSSIAAALHRNGETSMDAFTFVFNDPLYNEGPLANQVANKFGLRLNTIELEPDDLKKSLAEAAWLYDEPLVHQNDAQMLALSRAAKKRVTVLLSGEGADELMGGYVRYKPLNYYHFLRMAGMSTKVLKYVKTRGIVNRFEKLDRYLDDHRIKSLVLLNASNIYPSDLVRYGMRIDINSFNYRNVVLQEAIDLYPSEPSRQAMYMDLFIHMSSVLDRNDRMTMGASIECRVPFLDYRLMEMIPALPTKNLLKGKKGKYLLYNSVARKLPASVLSFKKLGFSVPWDEYMRKDEIFKESVNQIESGSLKEFLPDFKINQLLTEYKSGSGIASTMLKQLLMTNSWKENYLDKL